MTLTVGPHAVHEEAGRVVQKRHVETRLFDQSDYQGARGHSRFTPMLVSYLCSRDTGVGMGMQRYNSPGVCDLMSNVLHSIVDLRLFMKCTGYATEDKRKSMPVRLNCRSRQPSLGLLSGARGWKEESETNPNLNSGSRVVGGEPELF